MEQGGTDTERQRALMHMLGSNDKNVVGGGNSSLTPQGKPTSSKKKSKIIICVAAVVILIAAIIFILFASFGKKNNDTNDDTVAADEKSGTSIPVVCGSEMVDRYNELASAQDTDGYMGNFNSLVSEVESKSGYEGDATCQWIIFENQMASSDYDSAYETISAIEALGEKGLFPNNNLTNIYSTKNMKQIVESVRGSYSSSEGDDEVSI